MDKELSAWEKYKKNLGSSRPWHLLDKNNHVSRDIQEERISICLACPKFIKSTSQCSACLCYMPAKTKLLNASCPDGKWGEIERDNND